MADLATNGKRKTRPFSDATWPTGGRPVRPLFGRLPLVRWLPQTGHAVVDGLCAAAVLTSVTFATLPATRAAAIGFGAAGLGVAAVTKTRPSVAKLIPIEAHQAFDHVWGLALVAAPFALRYAKRDAVAAAVHVASGVLTLAAALLSDYRSA